MWPMGSYRLHEENVTQSLMTSKLALRGGFMFVSQAVKTIARFLYGYPSVMQTLRTYHMLKDQGFRRSMSTLNKWNKEETE
jgi:hypothetical protein